MWKRLGILEKRLFLQIVQDRDREEYSPDIFTNDEDNQIHHLINIEEGIAHNYTLVPVQNAKKNHVFMFNKETKTLNIYSIESEIMDQEQMVIGLQMLN